MAAMASAWATCAQTADNQQAPAAEPSKAVPSVVIRSETRLVQLSVIATDKKGHAVENLNKEDFVLLDNGKPQNISLFSTDSATHPEYVTATSDAKNALPPNVFGNRLRHEDEPPGSVTVILFDALNTSFTDQAYARIEVLALLQQLQPKDHVAVYLLTNHLQVINEFTQDSKALLQAIERFQAMSSLQHINSSQLPISAADTGIPDPKGAARAAALMNDMTSKLSDLADASRVDITAKAIEAIANHVAGIPGRKNLVWVSGAFPVSISLESNDNSPVDSEAQNFAPHLERVARALNQSNMAIYPVDARGLITGASMEAGVSHPFSPYRTPGGLGEGQDEQSTMNLLADRTGGHAFYNTNDIKGAIRRTLTDSHFTYALGYYPDHGDWRGQYHTLQLRAKKSGVVLRYRKGYFALADPPSTASQTQSALQSAVWSPVDATTMGIQAKVDSIYLSTRKLELRVNVDTGDLRLAEVDGHHTGKIDAIYLQLGPADAPLNIEPLTYKVDLGEKEYQSALKHGYELQVPLTIDPATKNLRVVVRDATSGVLGSVTIPLEKFLPPQTSTK
ncbi:MAG: VWA domain-containing protein [Candidatus Acidiferrum sp.]|jgi:VWFA-related protein